MVSEAQRTLVKSPPELWAELSDPVSLARHLGELGEIRITRSEPERVIEWEGESITGTVRLAPSGWGTKVALTATRESQQPEPPPAPEPEPPAEAIAASESEIEAPLEVESRRGFFARLFRRRERAQAVAATEPDQTTAVPEPEPEPEPEATQPEPRPPDLAAELATAEELITDQTTAVLTAALDRLGAAHHRPFSRA
jgi:hypothetical protein